MTIAHRSFTLFDLISFITAAAIACALAVFHWRQWDAFGTNWTPFNKLSVSWFAVGTALSLLTFYLGAMTLRRLPSRERIVRSPGRAAVLAMCGAAGFQALASWDSFFASVFSLSATILHLPVSIGGAPLVAASAGLAAWATLSIASVATDDPDWLDRSGKACTLMWLILAFTQPILNLEVLKAIGFPVP